MAKTPSDEMDHRNIWKRMQAGDAYKMNVTVSGAGKEGWGAGGMVVVVGEGGRGGMGGGGDA